MEQNVKLIDQKFLKSQTLKIQKTIKDLYCLIFDVKTKNIRLSSHKREFFDHKLSLHVATVKER